MKAASGAVPASQTETERVYQGLKQEILAGRLPAGSVLRQADLAARLRTSRTPVREAVARLGSELLVEVAPRRGARVADISIQHYLEVNQLRVLLHGAAARVAAQAMPDREIDRLQRALEACQRPPGLDRARLADADQLLHRLVARHCRNERMRRWIDQLDGMMVLVRVSDIEAQGEAMLASLAAICGALRSRDGRAAEQAMAEHVGSFTGRLPSLVAPRR